MIKWNPADYAGQSSQQQLWARQLLAQLKLGGNESVLDIGCGDGKVTAELARLVPHGRVVGIDSAPEMVAYATELFPAENHPNLSFQVMDAAAMTFDAKFDRVFSNAVLHWLTDHRPAVAGVARALRANGVCLLQMGGRGNAHEVLAVLDEIVADRRWSECFAGMGAPYGFYGPEDYEPWLAEAGLAKRRLELVTKDMIHDGPEGLAGWVRTTWLPFTQRVPEALREAFVAAVVERYLAAHPVDAQGRTHVEMVRLEVEAVRSG